MGRMRMGMGRLGEDVEKRVDGWMVLGLGETSWVGEGFSIFEVRGLWVKC